MAAEAGIIRYVITGVDDEIIPPNATHVSVHPSVTVIPASLFWEHRNIVELICHDGVIKIECKAFFCCRRLKRVIMKGVEVVELHAFFSCHALEYVECDKLEIIREEAFSWCTSLRSLNLSSANFLSRGAFRGCKKLKYVKFGKKMETVEEGVFYECCDLERITIPLKNGLIQHDNTFQLCENLKRVDFVEGTLLQETIDSLLCDTWRNDMNAEIDSIYQTLPNTYAGHYDSDLDYSDDEGEYLDPGEKARVIRSWIANVLRKVDHYKSHHRRLLKEAACRLQLSLPHDIVMNNVVPFHMLPHHSFDGEIERDDEELGMNSDDEDVDEPHTSKLGDEEEETPDEGSEGEDTDEAMEEAAEDVTGDGEKRKRRKTENDDVDGEDESD